jgi:predicted GNAT family acetyltransferase
MGLKYYSLEDRICGKDESGAELAEVCFPESGTNTVSITHTYVDPSLRGHGIADVLIAEVCKKMEQEGKKIVPVCSYAVGWFERNPDKRDLLLHR